MDLDCPALFLSPSWRKSRIALVCATDALRLSRGGAYLEVPRRQACAKVQEIDRRDMGSLRSFVAAARMTSVPLSSLSDYALLALVDDAVKAGALVFLREGEGGQGKASDDSAEQRRLVRKLEDGGQGRLAYAGKQYKLVADLDLTKVPNRNSYEVVEHADATKILVGIAGQPSIGANRAALLLEARAKLSRDWHPPLAPDGLILLRRSTVQAVSSSVQEAPITPSQIKAMLTKTEWIEIEMIDDAGEPYSGPYRIELPDGSVTTGAFDDSGFWERRNIDPGKCKLALPNLRTIV
jgi:hypothetical protein